MIDLLVVIAWLLLTGALGIAEDALVLVRLKWRDNHGITHRRRRPWR